MKILLKIENIAFLTLGIYAFYSTGISWWWFFGLLFLPDISMLGYVFNTKTGAFFYNIFHHFALAILLFIAGKISENIYLEIAGIIFFSHSALDRILGYGLKYNDRFTHTHIGNIGNESIKK